MIRIAHAPTNRAIKSTEAFLSATDQLRGEGFDIEVDLIEGVSWAECLQRKSKADIYFDQVILGYGNNAIESWGMGIPVIAGAQPATLAEMERRFGDLPFYTTTPDSIYDSLKALVSTPSLRDEYGQRGLEHVRRWHDEAKGVEQLKDLYQRATR
jgi:glycosyltransferase involved in cell wall biosynthesis